jgi:hypothetical protein
MPVGGGKGVSSAFPFPFPSQREREPWRLAFKILLRGQRERIRATFSGSRRGGTTDIWSRSARGAEDSLDKVTAQQEAR